MRILVIPERLRSLSGQLGAAADDLRRLQGGTGAIWGGLDWEAWQKAGVEDPVDQARGLAGGQG